MLKHLILLTIIVIVSGSHVIKLGDANFNSEVIRSELPVMVKFFAPWCGHCQRLEPVYEEVAKTIRQNVGGIMIAEVNCDDEKQTCSEFGIQGFPTIKVFSGKGNQRRPTDYQGERSKTAMVRFVIKYLKGKSNLLSSLEEVETISKKNSVVLFTKKSNVPPLFKGLSANLTEHLAFGHTASDEAAEAFNVKMPSIVVFINGERYVYNGDLKFGKIRNWLVTNYFPNIDQKTKVRHASTGNRRRPTGIKRPKFADARITDEDSLKKLCIKPKGVCVIMIGENASSMGSLAKSFRNEKSIFFVHLKPSEAREIAGKFGIHNSGLVALKTRKGGKMRAGATNTSLNSKTVHNFVDRIAGGDLRYKKFEL
ncbi:hypothetical protein PCE1_002856 [Barthelona sp. PCE]